jgi:5'-3' exonuclease
MVVHLIDGTYELFRHFYGRRRGGRADSNAFGAAAGVLYTVLQTLEGGDPHVAVATDHVIESFRNDLWPGYKTGAGVDPALKAQFWPLEEALVALGIATFAMVELEADDALAAAARVAAADPAVDQVRIWTPDKDLGQVVVGDRVVQVDRRAQAVRNEAGVREKFGVDPVHVPDFLALVGDSADGYPGIKGIGAVGAAKLVNQHGPIEDFPDEVLGDARELALLFKDLATLRAEADVVADVAAMRWQGPAPAFRDVAKALGDTRLVQRADAAATAYAGA